MRFLIALLILLPISAQAFPEFIRHGYVNCLTCHVSPSGGGVLTEYGRTFSGEGLSTWSYKGEEGLFNGLVPREAPPKWLSLGGDVRGAQVHLENDQVKDGRFIFMQADAEAAARVGRFTFDVAGGRFQRGSEEPRFKARRFYAMYAPDDEFIVRVGRFLPTYGINLADHVISTREPLRFSQSLETYNAELSWITDTWSAVVTGVNGPVELANPDQERALTAQVAYAFLDTYKVGANVWTGRSDRNSRQLAGMFGLLGFAEHFYLLSEADLTWNRNIASDAATRGFAAYNRLGYEIVRGVHLLGTLEQWQTNFDDPSSLNDRYGIGTQLFPRPHFDFQLLWTKYRTRAPSEMWTDYAWLVLHYYL